MPLDEEALEAVANGGSIDLEKWTNMVSPILERLEYIVHNLFPIPKQPPVPVGQQYAQDSSQLSDANNTALESSNKENSAPGYSQPGADSPPSTERVPDSQPQSSDSIPPPLALLLSSIRASIQSFFVEKPPHTIQRFAELIIRPKAHYRTLPAYLRAVDRVVSVTSAADVFPFYTPTSASVGSNGLMHPANSAGTYLTPDYAHGGLGSDESLGGALLTPIPWVTNVPFDAEGGNSVEESAEAVPPMDTDTTILATTDGEEVLNTVTSPPSEGSDDVPHARGPSVVGVEDLGLQDGRGVEMDLGQQGPTGLDNASGAQPSDDAQANKPPAEEAPASADKDGDIVLDDSKPGEDVAKADASQADGEVTEGNGADAASGEQQKE